MTYYYLINYGGLSSVYYRPTRIKHTFGFRGKWSDKGLVATRMRFHNDVHQLAVL